MTAASKIIGYADRISVAAGERISFMVSCASPLYRADIVRLIHGDPHPQGPGRKEEQIDTSINGDYPGRIQEIHPGSYVVLPAAPLLADLSSFTLQAWIYPPCPGVDGRGF